MQARYSKYGAKEAKSSAAEFGDNCLWVCHSNNDPFVQ